MSAGLHLFWQRYGLTALLTGGGVVLELEPLEPLSKGGLRSAAAGCCVQGNR